ncbi:MAG TPA: hypothetical protein VGH10_08005 [Actinomycetota bacterium]|jgi:hypothetical protein
MSRWLPLADGTGSPLDQGVTSMLLILALFLGFTAFMRLRDKGFRRLPRPAAWGAAALACACVVLAVTLPPIIRPTPASTRPSSTAHVTILTPTNDQVFHGDPASVPIRLRITGGRIVPFTSSHLVPNEGHVHLFVDGRLVAMSYGLVSRVFVLPGTHVLEAEYVAVDHAPFDPRVISTVRFRVVG